MLLSLLIYLFALLSLIKILLALFFSILFCFLLFYFFFTLPAFFFHLLCILPSQILISVIYLPCLEKMISHYINTNIRAPPSSLVHQWGKELNILKNDIENINNKLLIRHQLGKTIYN